MKILGVLVVGAACMAGISHAASVLAWPNPYIAADARVSSVGDHININGVPTRIYRFTSESKPAEVVQYFREHIERNFIHPKPNAALPDQDAFAGRVGNFWVTLQLKQQGRQTVGTWSAIPQFIPDVRQRVERPPGFPQSAKLIQQVDSFDDGKRSQLAVGTDLSPVDGVAARLEDELQQQGFVKQKTPMANWPSPSDYVATFRKGREEVLATLSQTPGGTSVMINRISALEELK